MLLCVLGLTGSVAAALFLLPIVHRRLIADVLRDRLYCIRNTLFDEILERGGPLTHFKHGEAREQINGLIFLADRIDFFVAVACVRADRVHSNRGTTGVDLLATPNSVGVPVAQAYQDVHDTLKRFIFRSCITGVLIRPAWALGRYLWTRSQEAPAVFDIGKLLAAIEYCALPFSSLEERVVLPRMPIVTRSGRGIPARVRV